MDLTTPTIRRFHWPKAIRDLHPEQERIVNDFMQHWHEVLPRNYGRIEQFNHGYATRILPNSERFSTLELGAGLGGHIAFEDLSRQDYHCIELRDPMADEIRRRYPTVTVKTGDVQERLPYDDSCFDRVVVIHVLEHLPNLPATLDESLRVLKPGGLFTVVLPCDPGLAYEIARKISAERIFRRRYKMPYGWFVRREHINSPEEIVYLLRERFEQVDISYFPLIVPVINLNLCIGVTLKKALA